MAETRKTALGSPVSPRWDDAWIAEVEKAEAKLGRRICGAHAPSFKPCELDPEHENGRCPYHGGCPNIGAQPGNSNARTHGLYSRALRQCSNTCPMWSQCPYARDRVMQLDPKTRPVCAYEREEYDDILASFGDHVSLDADDPFERMQHRTLAMLQTLVHRALRALSVHNLSETTKTESPNYTFASEKISAIATAYMRLLREFRAHFKMYLDYLVTKIKYNSDEGAKNKPAGPAYHDPLAHVTREEFDAYDESMYQRDLARWKRQHEPGYVHDPASGDPLPNPRPPKREDYFNLIGPKRPQSENPHRHRGSDPPPWPDVPPEFA